MRNPRVERDFKVLGKAIQNFKTARRCHKNAQLYFKINGFACHLHQFIESRLELMLLLWRKMDAAKEFTLVQPFSILYRQFLCKSHINEKYDIRINIGYHDRTLYIFFNDGTQKHIKWSTNGIFSWFEEGFLHPPIRKDNVKIEKIINAIDRAIHYAGIINRVMQHAIVSIGPKIDKTIV